MDYGIAWFIFIILKIHFHTMDKAFELKRGLRKNENDKAHRVMDFEVIVNVRIRLDEDRMINIANSLSLQLKIHLHMKGQNGY